MPTPHSRPRRGRPATFGREAVIAATLEIIAERGAGRLTTREVAARAGVSEGSVFYHFTDRSGLLTAVIEHQLERLRSVDSTAQTQWATVRDGDTTGDTTGDTASLRPFLRGIARGHEAFMADVVAAMVAAQADAELRAGMAAFLTRNDFGPHRGVDLLARHLADHQAAGTVRADVDPRAVAAMLLGPIFMLAAQRVLVDEAAAALLPGAEDVATALAALLEPPDHVTADAGKDSY